MGPLDAVCEKKKMIEVEKRGRAGRFCLRSPDWDTFHVYRASVRTLCTHCNCLFLTVLLIAHLTDSQLQFL